MQFNKKFEKAMHCLRVLAHREEVQIRIAGQCFRNILGYDVFEVLPFVLLENAVKYSPRQQCVNINFAEHLTRISVQIDSIGPMLVKGEELRVFEQEFRGNHAKRVNLGTGTGLHFAKLVCDLHKTEISVRSGFNESFVLNGIPYSNFNVTLSVPTRQTA